jgi:hypothetical protein
MKTYLYYRKKNLIENEIIKRRSVVLELKDGRTVVIQADEVMKRKIVRL